MQKLTILSTLFSSKPRLGRHLASLLVTLFSLEFLSAGEISFVHDVRPILSDKCFKCHGPDEANNKSDLRLDSFEYATKDLGGYVGITPGDPKKSEVSYVIHSTDKTEIMPPPESKLALTEKEKSILDQWIKEGAVYQKHWAFTELTDSVPVPESNHPSAKTPVDHFIANKLKPLNISPSQETSKAQWLRRVSFDLTGLPPTIAELDHFIANTSPEAYKKEVERLTNTQAYAERMATEWLDVARYSDSYGYQVDKDRDVWRWRDWVIRSFQNNLPYSDFITHQIAGDMVENPTQETQLATAFNRLHGQKSEGGSDPEEFRQAYIADRVNTVGTAFMGLTMECTKCHDHKYDPLTQEDYFSMAAFFSNIDEFGLYAYFHIDSVPTPSLSLTTSSDVLKIQQLKDKIAPLEEQYAQSLENNIQQESYMEPIITENYQTEQGDAHQFDGDTPLEILRDAATTKRHLPWTAHFELYLDTEYERAMVYAFSKATLDAVYRGQHMILKEGRLSALLAHFYPGEAIEIITKEKLPTQQWIQLSVSYDGSSLAKGFSVYLDGKLIETETTLDYLSATTIPEEQEKIELGAINRDKGLTNSKIKAFQLFEQELTAQQIAQLHSEGKAKQVSATTIELAERLQNLREELFTIENNIPKIMTMKESLYEERKTYILNRGNFNEPTREVSANTPTFLPPISSSEQTEEKLTRLDFAKWLTNPNHPLTARVTVNRYWQLFFGTGLVSTSEDFGNQGKLPSHPELLDWLARDFIQSGWNLHHLIGQIVLSHTYRQSSIVNRELEEIDPENTLLAYFPTTSLTAEMLRDSALANSQLLSHTMGGKPVHPYDLEFSLGGDADLVDEGKNLYRRSLYTYWKVNGPSPLMLTLDAAKRSVCTVKREQTSTPLQSLVLLNSPQFVEAARVTAENLIQKFSTTTERCTQAYRLATSQPIHQKELTILETLYTEQLAHFQNDPEAAKELTSVGKHPAESSIDPAELAAYTNLILTLWNYAPSTIKY